MRPEPVPREREPRRGPVLAGVVCRALLLVLAALLAAGCDSGSESARENPATTAAGEPAATAPPAATDGEQPAASPTESRVFTKAQLPRLALQPSDAPRGMRYTKAESGPRAFADAGIVLDEQVAQVRRLGLRSVYDAIFDSSTSDVRLAARLWLFKRPAQARRWLAKTKNDSLQFVLTPLAAPRLADGSWAAGGSLGDSAVITHAFRAGNLVVVVTLSTQTSTLSEADALAAARKAAARTRRV